MWWWRGQGHFLEREDRKDIELIDFVERSTALGGLSGGVDWGTCNRNHRDIDYSILSRVYMRHIYRVRMCVCVFIVVHSWRPFRGASLFLSESPVVVFFRRDNRFAALLECTRIYLCPTANPVRGGKVCLSSLLGLSSRGEWCIARITPVSIRIRKEGGKFSSFSIDSSIDFNCTIIEEEEKNGRALDMYRDMHATNVINERRCSCTRRILRNHVIRGNRSRDHAREEVISNYSTISEVALSDLASGLVDREWIIRERKKEKDQAFKLFAKLLLG